MLVEHDTNFKQRGGHRLGGDRRSTGAVKMFGEELTLPRALEAAPSPAGPLGRVRTDTSLQTWIWDV